VGAEPGAKLEGYAEDVRWLLERLQAGEATRLDSGGGGEDEDEEYHDVDGAAWSRDRFFTSGRTSKVAIEIQGTRDAALYQTERWFPPEGELRPGYRLPLPQATYNVTLHFAEIWFRTPGSRLFDVLLEGKKVLEAYEPLAAGFAVAQEHGFTVEVTDGFLEVEVVRRNGNPQVSALEVERGE
jgi:hypothetical protein